MSYAADRRRFLRTISLTSLSALIAKEKLSAQADTALGQPVLKLLTPASDGYDLARQLFNSRLNLRPAFVSICTTEKQIAESVRMAKTRKLQVTVKSGGHSFEGFSSNDGGLMINLSQMKGMKYDAKTHTLVAQPGCRLGEVGQWLFSKGRLLPSGSCAGVGLAGLTLGGGYGLFARKYGLTCDRLTGLRMVDGQGRIHDSDDDPELLKACRGGGNGNFGIITQLRFLTVPAPKTFRSQRIRFRKLTPSKVGELADLWFTATSHLPGDVFSAFVLNGSSLTILITFFDKKTDITRSFAALRKQAWKNEPIHVAPTARAVKRYYGRPGPLPFKNASAGYYASYEKIAKIIPEVAKQVSKVSGTVWQVNTLGGAIDTPEFEKQSVYPHRHYPWLGEIQGYWNKPSRAEKLIDNVAAVQKIFARHGIKDHYRNYPDIDFENHGTSYYGVEGLNLLRKIKQRYDPENTIRHPQSIAPK